MQPSIRHLRMFQTLAETRSVTRAAELCRVSQPAVTQAMNKLEAEAGLQLLQRSPQGVFFAPAGEVLARRTARALGFLDHAMADMSASIRLQATRAQLMALIAVSETGNFTLAANRLGLAQPTVHRSISLLEHAAGVQFFERTGHGLIATRAARQLAQAARLAFAEISQAEGDLAALSGREVGRIVVGALPLSRTAILPAAMLRFREKRPGFPFEIVDGRYDELLGQLRRGEIDLIVGALRFPAPIEDILQEVLFEDSVVIVARHGHPVLSQPELTEADLSHYPWVAPRAETPIRRHVQPFLDGRAQQDSIVTSSVVLMREILSASDHLGAVSRMQADAHGEAHSLAVVPFAIPGSLRPIGITTRQNWEPTAAQRDFIALLRELAAERSSPER